VRHILKWPSSCACESLQANQSPPQILSSDRQDFDALAGNSELFCGSRRNNLALRIITEKFLIFVRIRLTMRPLTEQETQTLFSKLANYTGRSLTNLIAPPASADGSTDEDRYVFRLHESRVYYVRLSLANLATCIERDKLLSLGTCLGKFTKTGKFRLHITALDVIAPHARYKVWVKPNGEMPLLYGGNIVKAHVGRWSEDCPEHQGVVVLGMDDTPLVCDILRSQYDE
jgi:60S ribosome subunit biogenesis protein NIP7